MSAQQQPFAYLSDSLERQLIEREMRAEAQRFALRAMIIGIKRVYHFVRSVIVSASELQSQVRNNQNRTV
jgi:hypothetical protein